MSAGLKILYAASNNLNSRIQLERFLRAVHKYDWQIRIAAYKISSPKNTHIDWTLDCLLNYLNPDATKLDHDNTDYYLHQIKQYKPDLVISDLEILTSYLLRHTNTPIWQCSSFLIDWALVHRFRVGFHCYYKYPLRRKQLFRITAKDIIRFSHANFIYSHFGEMVKPPKIKEYFHWVRPYHEIGKINEACRHQVVAINPTNNKSMLVAAQQYPDAVVFSQYHQENYQNIQLKNIYQEDEYFCNIKNCDLVVSSGHISFLADAFYNGKNTGVYADFNDPENLLNSRLTEYLGIGKMITHQFQVNQRLTKPIKSVYRPEILYLDEYIDCIYTANKMKIK